MAFDAKHLSTAAKRVCRNARMTPRWFEPLNSSYSADQDGTDDTPVLRVWNSKREIIITAADLFHANQMIYQ